MILVSLWTHVPLKSIKDIPFFLCYRSRLIQRCQFLWPTLLLFGDITDPFGHELCLLFFGQRRWSRKWIQFEKVGPCSRFGHKCILSEENWIFNFSFGFRVFLDWKFNRISMLFFTIYSFSFTPHRKFQVYLLLFWRWVISLWFLFETVNAIRIWAECIHHLPFHYYV